jgi:hypothetical protein
MDPMDKKQTLMEKNRLYQQRYAEKKRLELGDEAYREQHNKKIQAYREQRKKDEGYVKKPPVEPIMKAPKQLQPKRDLKLKPVNENKKQTKKEVNQFDLQKLKLMAKTLSQTSVDNYVSKHTKIYEIMTGEFMNGTTKGEIKKAILGQTYDDDLADVLYYFDSENIRDCIFQLNEEFPTPNTFKTYTTAITALLGRMSGFNTSYEYVSTLGKDLQKEYVEERGKNEVSQEDYDKIQLLKFDDKSIKQNINKLTNLKDQSLYAIYMYIPRRLELRTVRIRKNTTNTDNGNYVILNRNDIPIEFIFNDYKTAKAYKQQTIPIPVEIQPFLHEYILRENLKTDDFLFPLGRDSREPLKQSIFSQYFTKVFNDVYGKRISNQILRIGYATYFTKGTKSQKQKVADALSHSYSVNEEYVKLEIKKE